MDELKPCPFCGKEKARYALGWYGITIFQCQNCGAAASSYDDWNFRPEEDRLKARIAELEEELRMFRQEGEE